ncbi:unnamed protein product, partial [Ectocarpus sp. 13 AM-2016]
INYLRETRSLQSVHAITYPRCRHRTGFRARSARTPSKLVFFVDPSLCFGFLSL